MDKPSWAFWLQKYNIVHELYVKKSVHFYSQQICSFKKMKTGNIRNEVKRVK